MIHSTSRLKVNNPTSKEETSTPLPREPLKLHRSSFAVQSSIDSKLSNNSATGKYCYSSQRVRISFHVKNTTTIPPYNGFHNSSGGIRAEQKLQKLSILFIVYFTIRFARFPRDFCCSEFSKCLFGCTVHHCLRKTQATNPIIQSVACSAEGGFRWPL